MGNSLADSSGTRFVVDKPLDFSLHTREVGSGLIRHSVLALRRQGCCLERHQVCGCSWKGAGKFSSFNSSISVTAYGVIREHQELLKFLTNTLQPPKVEDERGTTHSHCSCLLTIKAYLQKINNENLSCVIFVPSHMNYEVSPYFCTHL